MDTYFWNEVGSFFCGHAARMLVQSGLLILILVGLDRLLVRRVRASVRYGIWMLALAKLMLPTTLSFPTGAGYWLSMPTFSSSPAAPLQETQPVSQAEATVQAPLPQAEIHPVSSKASVAVPQAPAVSAAESVRAGVPDLSWEAFLLGGWLLGVVVLSCAFGIRLVMVRRILRAGRPASNRCRRIFARCVSQTGGGRAVTLIESDRISSPAVCGLLRPTLLMPAGLEDKLTDEQLLTILLHERGHIQRGDLWVHLLQTLLQIVYFYNPFVWLANHSIRRVREQANDERVLVMLGGGRECYSHTLIEVARAVFGKPMPALRLIGVMETKTQLNERIKHMIERPLPKSSKLGWTGLAAVALLACLLLPMAQGKFAQAAQPEKPAASALNPEQQKILSEFEGMEAVLVEALNDGNINRILSLFVEDGIRLPNQAEAVMGRAALNQFYLNMIRQSGGIQILDLNHQSEEFWEAGDLVVSLDQYSVTFKTAPSRYLMTDYQKDISIFRRQADGSLKMIAGADNQSPIPQNTDAYRSEKKQKEPRITFHSIETKSISADELAKHIETVKALDIEFHECFIRHDADAALKYYAEDAVLLPLNKNIVRGKAALIPFIKDGMKEAELVSNNQQILGAGGTDGMIYILNQFNWQFKTPDNPQEIQSFPGKGIHVWQRQPDGRWKILLDLYNISIPLPEV